MDPKDAVRHLKTLVYGSDSLRPQQKAIADSCFKKLGLYTPEPIVELEHNEFECPNCQSTLFDTEGDFCKKMRAGVGLELLECKKRTKSANGYYRERG